MKVSQMDDNIDDFKSQYDSDKALIRTNLATMGVSSQSSDSLTTLAGKILQVPSGGGAIFEDDCSTDKTTDYVVNNVTLTYDSTENAYKIHQNSTNNTHGTARLPNVLVGKTCKVTFDIKLNNTTNNLQSGLQIGNILFRIIYLTSSSVKRITILNGSSDVSYTNVSNLTHSTWYTIEISLTEGSATFTLKEGSTSLASITGNISSYIDNNNNTLYLAQGVRSESDVYALIRNIKVYKTP